LVQAVQWQEDPAIVHDEVKIGGQFGIFYPSWNTEITLPNGATEQEIFSIIDQHLQENA
jgi:DNA polymerase-1